MVIPTFDETSDDIVFQTWSTVVRFLFMVAYKIDNKEEISKACFKVEKMLIDIEADAKKRKIKFKDNDIRFCSIAFVLVDTYFTDRNVKESQEMFMRLLALSANALSQNDIAIRPSAYTLDQFLTIKIIEVQEPTFYEWFIMQEFLCTSLHSEAKVEAGETPVISHMLYSVTPDGNKYYLQKLKDMQFDNMNVRIEKEKIYYNGE